MCFYKSAVDQGVANLAYDSATPADLTCPDADGTTFIDATGNIYQVQCDTFFPSSDNITSTAGGQDLTDCAMQCSNLGGCVGATYQNGTCTFFSSYGLGGASSRPGVSSLVLLSKPAVVNALGGTTNHTSDYSKLLVIAGSHDPHKHYPYSIACSQLAARLVVDHYADYVARPDYTFVDAVAAQRVTSYHFTRLADATKHQLEYRQPTHSPISINVVVNAEYRYWANSQHAVHHRVWFANYQQQYRQSTFDHHLTAFYVNQLEYRPKLELAEHVSSERGYFRLPDCTINLR
ncbi:hypothetical protein LTR09_001597 [Extremus antarcticus]|uniref:Apple domain-containing protein n=1 Tax=Extremus antarcticus TaxID=702011 RepID=A0AAJ0GH14_9PEZI|nr:hypothetical protein LTR09_001597 [Extremus antarcticus]